jgi:hypothetical protein
MITATNHLTLRHTPYYIDISQITNSKSQITNHKSQILNPLAPPPVAYT